MHLGLLAFEAGNLPRARDRLRQGCDLLVGVEDNPYAARFLVILACVCFAQGDIDDGDQAIDYAKTLHEALDEQPWQGLLVAANAFRSLAEARRAWVEERVTPASSFVQQARRWLTGSHAPWASEGSL